MGLLCVYEKNICNKLAGNVYIRLLIRRLLCCVASREHINESAEKGFNMDRVKAADTNPAAQVGRRRGARQKTVLCIWTRLDFFFFFTPNRYQF